MKTHHFALCALGFASAITFAAASTASAQATSQKRIPVRKDTPAAEVMAKTDTVRLPGRVDTVMVRGRTDTVTMTVRTRPDTVVRVQMEMLPEQKLPGTYFQIGAGVSNPMNSFRNFLHSGPGVNAAIGWFPMNGTLGLRAGVDWASFAHRKTECNNCPDTKALAGSADVLARFPIDRKSPLNLVFYLLGGGGVDKFTDFVPFKNNAGVIVTAGEDTYLGTPPGLGVTAANRGTQKIFYHYDVGAGFDFNVMSAHMFIETKYLAVGTNNGRSHYLPVTAGFKFY